MSNVIIILGMHRSGTSCLTGALEQCGLFLGPVSRDLHVTNPKGHFELIPIMVIHEDILRENNGSWRHPPSHIVVSDHQKARLRKNIALSFDGIFGFKDPRTLLFVDTWKEILPLASYVGTFRHPSEVASSLYQRDHIPIDEGLNLWAQYNQRLIQLYRQDPFPIIEFKPGPGYRDSVYQVAIKLGLKPSFDAINTFVDDNLNHGGQPDAQTSDLYETLQDISARSMLSV